MKNASTLFLKTVLFVGQTIIALICVFLTRGLLTQDLGGYFPIVAGMLIAAIPFFIGVAEVRKLLSYIDRKKAFSNLSVAALQKIKYCAVVISALYGIGLPYIFMVAEGDDAPGVILIGIVFTFAPLAVALFAGIFQKALKNAIELKKENDLIV